MRNPTCLSTAAWAFALVAYAGSVGGVEPVNPQPAQADPTATAPASDTQTAPANRRNAKKLNPPAKPKLNGLAQTAISSGIVDCVPRIQQVTDFLTANTKSGAFMFIAPTDANRQIVSASLEIQAGAVSSYASASFAPAGNHECSATYETVSYWANQCADVASRAFPTLPGAGKLGGSITMLDGGANLRVFLMPAGQGCLSIKKELIY